MKRVMLLAFAVTAACFAADLPVRQIILYKHGVGYFERSGSLAARDSARLEFKASEMNDVLKSLRVNEEGGGGVTGLRYDSSEPLARKLEEFPFRLGEGQPAAAVLDQLKGARLELRFANETIAGAIVGARLVPGTERQPERQEVTLLTDDGDLRTFDLNAASAMRLADSKLQSQFQAYLGVLSGARVRERRSVYIESTGSQARAVTAAYMIPMPVWKSSYRLIFGAGQPTLEGWAIVDNTTSDDWTNVRLSLVSGRPVSFVSRLYEPRYVARPGAELPEDQAQAPVVYEGALESKRLRVGGNVAGLAAGKGGVIGGVMSGLPAAAPPPPPEAEVSPFFDSTIAAAALGAELGELFEYKIAAPVTIRRGESAMLPFLQQAVEARRLLIYSSRNAAHPMNAAEITNSTGKTLDGGPITVYDAGVYAGEALTETVKAGDKRLISYAVDLGTRVTTQFDSKGELVREIHARRGILTTRVAAVETRTYTVRNVDRKEKTLIIEHAARPQYDLVSPEPWERSAGNYRFQVKLAPDSSSKFPVVEERVYENSFSIANLTPDVLFTYVQNKTLGDAARRQLEQVVDRKRRLAGADEEIKRSEAQIRELAGDQERIRQNLASLNRVSGQQEQVQTYARQLASQEGEIAKLRDGLAALRRQKASLEAEINGLIEALTF